MRTQPFSVRFRSVLTLTAVLLLAAALAAGQETPIFSFYSQYGDALPIGGLTGDAAGNLYGVTFYGGVYGNGTVYKLSPSASGWHISVLYSFNPNGIDGFGPTSAIVFDKAGNIYGTTEFGGTGDCTNGFGCGTVYELSPTGKGTWKETILHDFAGTDGWQIHPGLAMDGAGNLYGMATNGGTYKNGTIFEMSPSAGGWTFNVLYQFTGGNDGGVPFDGLTLDGTGNLYGTASAGGGKSASCRYGCGVVFELSPGTGGTWNETVLHNFTTNPSDGRTPACTLTFDAAGNLYGTTSSGGGSTNFGIVFELSPAANGSWREKILHNFNDHAGDGNGPTNSLAFDDAGNLYGATIAGGNSGHGTAFKLSPTASDPWRETLLNDFSEQGLGGYFPNSGLIWGPNGALYGVAASGGRSGQGTAYQLNP
ncbi:MAG TPA: choice-of-anchor tandem repeat GloVer-containing protein [Verrucomicrobiae bacterium]|nr:choice-of-anchor tandem repeat GloVer-containing protein [Verrucomicrobiae bacterium]